MKKMLSGNNDGISMGKTLALVGYGLVFVWWTFTGIAILLGWPAPDAARTTFDHWSAFLDWGNGVLLAGFVLYLTRTGQKIMEIRNGNGNGNSNGSPK